MDQPSNPALDLFDSVIDALIMNVAVTAAITAVTVQFPFLKIPIINQIFTFAMNRAFGFVAKYLKLAGDATIIDSQVGTEANACQDAKLQLKTALTTGDSNAIEKSKQDFKAAYAKLVHLDGR